MMQVAEREIVTVNRNEDEKEYLVRFLRELEQQGFYGSVEVKMERGKIVLIRKTETLKLHDLIAE